MRREKRIVMAELTANIIDITIIHQSGGGVYLMNIDNSYHKLIN